MKKIMVILILILLATTVAAQEVGTTPDSIFYGLDRAMESIKLAFTRNPEKRASVHLAHAEERIAELQEMIQKNKTKYTQKLLQDRENSLTKAQEEIQKVEQKGKDVSELAAKVEEVTSKHLAILTSLLEKVPEQAREHIQNAIEKSSRSKAVEAITKEKQEQKAEEREEETEIEQPQLPKKETKQKTGTLVMQITDKKPELDITSLKVTISNIKVHAAGTGSTTEEICTKENVTQEVCTNQTIPEIVPSCVNITNIKEICENVTIDNSSILNCTNQTIIEENCTNITINKTEEVCENITETIETCSNISETGENWFTIVEGPLTFDLIQLQDLKELLGQKELTAGKYTQIRLTISNAKLMIGNVEKPLKIPSGRIKLIKNFNIVEGQTTTLTLDFDAKKSVHQAGNKYIMKPTIKVIQE